MTIVMIVQIVAVVQMMDAVQTFDDMAAFPADLQKGSQQGLSLGSSLDSYLVLGIGSGLAVVHNTEMMEYYRSCYMGTDMRAVS